MTQYSTNQLVSPKPEIQQTGKNPAVALVQAYGTDLQSFNQVNTETQYQTYYAQNLPSYDNQTVDQNSQAQINSVYYSFSEIETIFL